MTVPAIPPLGGRRLSLLSGVLLSGLVGACTIGAQAGSPAYLDPAPADSTSPPPAPTARSPYTVVFPSAPGAAPVPLRPSPLLAELVIHARPDLSTVSVTRIDPKAGAEPIEIGVDNLRANADCPAGFQAATMCFDISLKQSFPRSLSHVLLQVTSITDPMTGLELGNHGGINGDSSEQGLDASKGLWQLTSPGSTTPGVVGQSPFDTAARQVVFANDASVPVDIGVKVLSSLAYGSYLLDYSSQPFIDACDGGEVLAMSPTSAMLALPFPFTLYGQTSSVAEIGLAGVIALGAPKTALLGNNEDLPSATAPGPAIFPFWDNIGRGASSGAVCARTLGSAPNRSVVLTWKDLDFLDPIDSGAHLTFSTVLSEGSDRIDVVYDAMNGPTERASGASATVGVQDAAGYAATAEFEVTDFGTGNAYTLVPAP